MVFQKDISRVLELQGETWTQEVTRHIDKDIMTHGAQEKIIHINHLRMVSGCKESFLRPRGEEMRHLSKDNQIRKNPKIKVEEIRLVEQLFGRLVVDGIEKCPDHQAVHSRDLGISVGGQSLPEEKVV